MDFENLIVKIAKILERLDIPYIITGGYAVAVWGRLRATFDVDVVIEMLHPNVAAFAKAMRTLGKEVYVDEAMIRETLRWRGEFNVIHGESGLKIDFFIPRDIGQTKKALARARFKKVKGQRVYFISPEDLILSKLRWVSQGGGEKHMEDAQSVVKRSGDILDRAYLEAQAKEQKVQDLWRRVRSGG